MFIDALHFSFILSHLHKSDCKNHSSTKCIEHGRQSSVLALVQATFTRLGACLRRFTRQFLLALLVEKTIQYGEIMGVSFVSTTTSWRASHDSYTYVPTYE